MRIERIDIPQELSVEFGLPRVQMSKLNEVVVLAGKNGSGKTRVLNLIKSAFQRVPNVKTANNIETYIKGQLADIAASESMIKSLMQQKATKSIDREIDRFRGLIIQAKDAITRREQELIYRDMFEFNKERENDQILTFVPKAIDLSDSYLMNNDEISTNAHSIYRLGINNIDRATFPAIQFHLNKWQNARIRHIDKKISNDEFAIIDNEFRRLQRMIKTFLGADLSSDENGIAMLFNKRLGHTLLSDGQKVLLQFAIAMFGQETRLSDVIVFMDEPENHLHPAALTEVLDTLKKNITNGQIWIATHSINVLAHFDTTYSWYIEDGMVSYAGNVPQKVLRGLLGNEDEINKLADYLVLPAKLASENFAYQCLVSPGVAAFDNKDPQTNQIQEILTERSKSGITLRVLDIGVGKGRLIATIAENERLANRQVNSWLDYYAYEPDPTYSEVASKQLKDVYNDDKRYFSTNKEVLSFIKEKTLDVIIMCNVLHEVDPCEWIEFFTSPTSFMRLLKPEGILLIVEDQLLAVGEKAHSKGFLVLDTVELQALFGEKGNKEITFHDKRGDGRLKAHFIPAKYLMQVTNETRRDALMILQSNSKASIKEIRGQVANYKNGKLHSFWTQQFANASLALAELG